MARRHGEQRADGRVAIQRDGLPFPNQPLAELLRVSDRALGLPPPNLGLVELLAEVRRLGEDMREEPPAGPAFDEEDEAGATMVEVTAAMAWRPITDAELASTIMSAITMAAVSASATASMPGWSSSPMGRTAPHAAWSAC